MSADQYLRKPKRPKGKLKNNASPLSSYARWSSLVFQMGAIVLAGYFGGMQLDKFLKRDDSIITLIGVVTGVIVAMVLAIKTILDKKNQA